MIADTRNWGRPGKKVIISPQWISRVDWKNSNLSVNSRHAIKSGPEYDPERLSRAYEANLYGHYGEPNYWWW